MSNAAPIPDDFEVVPPQCRATADAIQRALDGDAPLPATDSHLTACAACRERVRAARVLLSVLATPAEPVAVPAGFADRVLVAMSAERREPARGRIAKAVAWLALAAAVLVGVWLIAKPAAHPQGDVVEAPPVRVEPPAPITDVPPTPTERAPEPRPVRVSDALASTGQALRDAPRPLADSVAVAPKVFDVLAESFKLPEPAADPMAQALEPTRRSLDALPVAARSGLEPVTGTAEKAFNRFLRDVGAVKPN
jgi:hypothetical protein